MLVVNNFCNNCGNNGYFIEYSCNWKEDIMYDYILKIYFLFSIVYVYNFYRIRWKEIMCFEDNYVENILF